MEYNTVEKINVIGVLGVGKNVLKLFLSSGTRGVYFLFIITEYH